MNKDLLDQIPAEEQPIASKLSSLVDDMQPSQAFQWELENRLIEKATAPPTQSWFSKILVSVAWTIAAIGGVILLNRIIGSSVPQPSPAAGPTVTQEVSFAASVRTGEICIGPLAIGHGFAVFLTNPEKTEFALVDAGDPSGELRSFTWSADGEQLAIVGNWMGSGNVYLADPLGTSPQPILPNGEVGYLMDGAWSRDGSQLVLWSSQNNTILYLVNADGTGLVEKQLNMHILGTPQFTLDGESVILFGADGALAGLFEVILHSLETRIISSQVEDDTGYSFSPDGSHLAYMEMDRNIGEARLILEEFASGGKTVLGTLPIPAGSGSSIPESANMRWSADGNAIVFDFGRYASDRAIYLTYVDGTELVKLVDSAYAPTISADGKCLAYISDNQVFLMDLTSTSVNSTTTGPLFLANVPAGRGIPNFKQDKLQWSPATDP